MPDELVQDRTISGTGVLRIVNPPSDVRRYTLYIDLIRESKPDYRSKKYAPNRQRIATMVLLRDGYVVGEEPIDYEKRRFDYILDIAGQNLIAIKCAYKGTLQSFANLGTALGLTVVQVTDLIKDYKSLNLLWDEARFVCEGSAAIQVRLYRSKYEKCDNDSQDEDKPSPPPPPLPKVPPDSAISDISRPYPDDDITSPNPGDSVAPPPSVFPYGTSCKRYKVYAYLQPVNGLGQPVGNPQFGAGLRVWGKVESVQVVNQTQSGFNFVVTAHGDYDLVPCSQGNINSTFSAAGQFLGQYRIRDGDTDAIIYEGDGTVPE